MAYIDWWNRTGPITMGERFGLNEISIARKTLSPTKSYTDGGRIGFRDAGIVDNMVKRYNLSDAVKQDLTTLYKNITNQKSIHEFPTKAKTAVIKKRLTDFASEFKKATGRLPVRNEIRSFGVASQTITTGKKGTYLIDGVNFMEETEAMRKTKWRTRDIPEIQTKIIDAYNSGNYTKADGTPNIKQMAKDFYPDKELDDARRQIRETLKREVSYVPKANVPGDITAAKKAWNTAQENIAIAETKAGKDTVAQANNVINSIKKLNDPYKEMSVKDIAKDKNLLKRLRLQINSTTGNVNFNGYTKLDVSKKTVMNDLELAAHAKKKASTNELFTHDHISKKSLKKMNVQFPNNIQGVTYIENSHLDNGRTYLLKNPNGSNVGNINNYLKSNNLTIRGSEFKNQFNTTGRYGFLEPIEYNSKTGTSNIVQAAKTPIKSVSTKALDLTKQGGTKVLSGVDAVFRPLFVPAVDLAIHRDATSPTFWMTKAFWANAMDKYGITRTYSMLKDTPDFKGKSKILRDIALRGIVFNPKAVRFISSKIAWPATAAASVYDAYKDYKRTDADIKKRWEDDPEGMKKQAMEDAEIVKGDTSEMFAMGGIASLIK